MFSLGRPRAGVEREARRYYAKWRVDGRDRTRSFKSRAEADRFRTRLATAAHDGLEFDATTGLPVAWLPTTSGPTWWTWSREWLDLKWPQWSGHTRRTAVESLTALTPLLVSRGAAAAPDGLAAWLREVGYRPGHDHGGAIEGRWLQRWSVPLAAIDAGLLEDVLVAVCRRADGSATVPAVSRRRRNSLGAVLRSAVRRGVLDINPMDRIEWRTPARSMAVDVATVPSPAEIAAVVEVVASSSSNGARYAALFAAVGMAGMRPSEAIGLLLDDVDLPADGWGTARLRGAVTAPGTRYTADGGVVEAKGLKQRAPGATRDVPLAPALVAELCAHLDRFTPVDGHVFSNAAGRPITPTNYGPVWIRARTQLWPERHPLASATVYDLRHGAATMMLRAGVPPAEVARRLGHSVDVLMRVYAGVFDDERERSNELIDLALSKSEAPRRRDGAAQASAVSR